MAPKSSIIAVSAVIALLVAASVVAAEGQAKGQAQAHVASPPDQAQAHGLTKHDEPPPAIDPPATEPTTTAPPTQAPTPAPPAAIAPAPVDIIYATAASSAPGMAIAAAPAVDRPSTQPRDGVSTAPAGAAFPTIVTAPSSEDIFEARSGAATGATTTRAPSWASDPRAAPTSGQDASAPWWVKLTWALPFIGMGGVAAVLVLRQKSRRTELAMAMSTSSSSLRMAPVSPDDIKGILQNGHAAASRGAFDEAVAWFERALKISPKLGVAYFCKGVCLAANGDVSNAYGALRTACTVDPEDASYRVHFARVAIALGKHKEAMDALELIARAMPELGPAMLDDPQLAGLRDHPRFLMICGAL